MAIKNITATYEREIERKPFNDVIFYGIFAALILFITIIYGIKPAAKTLAQNYEYKEELVAIQSNMTTKLRQIEDESQIILDHEEKIQFLTDALPEEILFEQFLEEFVLVAAKTGFILQRVQPVEEIQKEVQILLEMQGQITQLPDLLKNIEEMNRFTAIESIITHQEEDYIKVSTKLKVFIL